MPVNEDQNRPMYNMIDMIELYLRRGSTKDEGSDAKRRVATGLVSAVAA